MKRYFTLLSNALVSGKNHVNGVKMFFLAILMCGMSNFASAAITVTPATGGTNICSNLAGNGSAPAYTTLGTITIAEGLDADFGGGPGGWNLVLTVNTPAGWSFNTGVAPTIAYSTLSGSDITGTIMAISFTSTGLEIFIRGTGDTHLDTVTIAGLQVEANTTSSVAGNMYATITTGTATGITTGVGGTNFGSLSQTPDPITGAATAVCIGNTIQLSDASTGGAWNTGASTTATGTTVVGGLVTPATTAGVAVIEYTLAGCTSIYSVTVNAAPTAISGSATVCSGLTTTLSDAIIGGVWTSATTTVATVGSASGVITGVPTVITPSTSVITYSITACPVKTYTVTVNPTPGAVAGNTIVCISATTTLSDNIAGGTWSSAMSAVATVGSVSGIVSGAGAGMSQITYEITATGCSITTTVTVHAPPSPISGNLTVCSGLTTTLSNTAAGGVWSSATTTVATVGTANGIVTGVPTVTTTSTSVITYSVSACSAAVITVTVNPTPTAITGPTAVCRNSTITLSDAIGSGVWSSSNTTMATVVGGVVTGAGTGTPLISYTIGGCAAIYSVTVNPQPFGITGTTSVCTGLTTALTDGTVGGAWSSVTTGVAIVGTGTGIVTGLTAGTSVINYTLNTGCLRSTTVTVNQSPGPITGTANACVGQMTDLSDNIAGGVWMSGTTTIATVGSASGVVSGAAPGTSVITYKIPVTNCAETATVTINAVPSAIGGTTTLCQGTLTSLSDSSPGGTWSSSNTSVATVNGGLASGVAGGTANITYGFGSTCYSTTTLTVNPLPVTGVITGPDSVCLNSIITLSDASAGGVWSSSNTGIATVSSAGVVSGFALGTINITYTVTNGCGSLFTSFPLTVDLLVPQVTISANPGLTSCIGIPDTFTANVVNGGTSPIYQWKVNGTIVSTTNPYTYTPANGDIVVCTITSNAPCISTTVASDTITMVVNGTLVPSVTISTGAYTDTVCTGTLTQFTATPVNGGPTPTYQWSVNGALTGTGNPFNYTPANGDTITCQLTSSYACAMPATAMSNTVTMTVVSSEAPTVDITASANPSCEGYPVTFTAHTLYGGISPFIRWTQNSINVATGPTYTIVPHNGDEFYCVLKSSNSCSIYDSVFSNNIIMTVDTAIAPVVSVVAANTVITTAQYDSLVATVTPVTITPTYQWYLNGVAIAGATSSVYVAHVNTSGIDYFYCIVGNGNACNTSTISNLLTITVNPSTGVNQVALENDDIKLVPNPNDGEFTVAGTLSIDNQNVTIEITNVVGQVVYKDVAPVQNEILNKQVSLGSELTNGVYLLNVITNNGHKVIRFTLSR